jgi:UDP-N-acetylmuramyl pentapeptide synthase
MKDLYDIFTECGAKVCTDTRRIIPGSVFFALKGDNFDGNDFAAAAKAFSSDSQAAEGGVWKNIVPSEVFKPEICDEISKMPRGTMSHWIELDGWSFLIRKESETTGKALSFEEAYDKIEAAVKDAEAERLYKAWIERLRAETYIKVF